ncbi:MAG: SLBB domain-containing protein [Desulfatiglandales bacterium]
MHNLLNPSKLSRLSHILPLLCCVALLSIIFISQSCSSTAIMGTPVKDLVKAEDERVVKKVLTVERNQEIAHLSRVKGNKVFLEIAGIPEYRIGSLDVLEINSHVGDQVNKTTVTVSSRGKISYTFIDDLEVVGLTPSQLDRLLTKKLSGFVRSPRIDILVTKFRSKTAMIMGELASLRLTNLGKAASGRFYLKGKTTVTDLIAQAGGYTVDADVKNIKITRGKESYMINLYDIIERGDKNQNVIIDDGDVVDVPLLGIFGERIYVLGEVKKQGVYRLDNAQDLLAAISLAGSYTNQAKEENTLIVRGYEPGKEPLVMMADVKALLRKGDLSQNIRLRDGDLVYVPSMLIGDINRWIDNISPMLDILLWPGKFDTLYFDDRRLFFETQQ